MRRINCLFLLLAAFAAAAHAQAEPGLGFFAEEPAGLEVRTFVLALESGTTMNCYLAWDPAALEALVIDPGAPVPEVLAFIRARGLKVLAVLNTHGHYDHVGGVPFLAEKLAVPAYLHPADLPLAARTLGAGFPFRSYPTDGRLRLGGLELEVIAVPGHSPGSVCLRSGGILFSGDTLFAGAVGKPHGDSADRRRANLHLETENILRRLLALPAMTRVLPGHGPSTTVGAEKAGNPFLKK